MALYFARTRAPRRRTFDPSEGTLHASEDGASTALCGAALVRILTAHYRPSHPGACPRCSALLRRHRV